MEHILRLGRQYKPPKSTILIIHLWNFQDIILTLSDLVYYKTFRWWRHTLSITILSAKMAIFTIVYQILTKAVVVLKDTRCTVNATCLSMVAKKNSLAFDLYPTFVILIHTHSLTWAPSGGTKLCEIIDQHVIYIYNLGTLSVCLSVCLSVRDNLSHLKSQLHELLNMH